MGGRGSSNGRGGSPLPPARVWPWRSGERGEGGGILTQRHRGTKAQRREEDGGRGSETSTTGAIRSRSRGHRDPGHLSRKIENAIVHYCFYAAVPHQTRLPRAIKSCRASNSTCIMSR